MAGFRVPVASASYGVSPASTIAASSRWIENPGTLKIWGESDPPNTLVPVARLKEDFLPYQRPRAKYPKRDGQFMLILPVLPRNTVAR